MQEVRLTRKRILSGMRPTGKLHLGNLHGALSNWIALQNHGDYDCFYFVADWHALTSDYADTGELRANTSDIVIDWLSAGLDPVKKHPLHSVHDQGTCRALPPPLHDNTLAWLERNPTYKEMKEELIQKDLSTFGFLGYPVLQAADIIMYKAYGVPVGVDQLPHVELTREIARRFNFLYADIFPIPEPLLAEVPKLLGIDGRKMSKSYDNAIFMSDRGDDLKKKVGAMFTGSPAAAQERSGPSGTLQCLHVSRALFSAGNRCGDRLRLPERGHRLHRMQAAPGRRDRGGDGNDPSAAGPLPEPSRRGPGDHRRRKCPGRPDCKGDAGRGAGSHENTP